MPHSKVPGPWKSFSSKVRLSMGLLIPLRSDPPPQPTYICLHTTCNMYTHTRVCTKRQIPVLPCSLRHTLQENHARTLKDAVLAETPAGPTHAAEPPAGPGLAHLSPSQPRLGREPSFPPLPLPRGIVQAPNQGPGSDSSCYRRAEGQSDCGPSGRVSLWLVKWA